MTELIKAGSGKKKKKAKIKVKVDGKLIRLADFNHRIDDHNELWGTSNVDKQYSTISERAYFVRTNGFVRQNDYGEEAAYFNIIKGIKPDFVNLCSFADVMRFSFDKNMLIESKTTRFYAFAGLKDYPEIELIELRIPFVKKKMRQSVIKGGLAWNYHEYLVPGVFNGKTQVEDYSLQIIFSPMQTALFHRSIGEPEPDYKTSLLIPMFNSDKRIPEVLRKKEGHIFVFNNYETHSKLSYYDVADTMKTLETKLKTAIKNYGMRI